MDLFNASGWSQAEAARKLDMTRGGMHGIINGDTIPSIPTVRLFRLVLQSEKPDVRLPSLNETPSGKQDQTPREDEAWVREFIAELKDLTPAQRHNVLEGVRAFLRNVPRQPVLKKHAA